MRPEIDGPIFELALVKAGMVEKRYQLLLARLTEGDAIGGKLPLQPLECIHFRRVRKQWHVTLDPVLAMGDPVRHETSFGFASRSQGLPGKPEEQLPSRRRCPVS